MFYADTLSSYALRDSIAVERAIATQTILDNNANIFKDINNFPNTDVVMLETLATTPARVTVKKKVVKRVTKVT